jgi:hypothetical protein
VTNLQKKLNAADLEQRHKQLNIREEAVAKKEKLIADSTIEHDLIILNEQIKIKEVIHHDLTDKIESKTREYIKLN